MSISIPPMTLAQVTPPPTGPGMVDIVLLLLFFGGALFVLCRSSQRS